MEIIKIIMTCLLNFNMDNYQCRGDNKDVQRLLARDLIEEIETNDYYNWLHFD